MMLFALIVLVFVSILLFVIYKQNLNIKLLIIVIFLLTTILTVYVCITQPMMHNRMSLNVMDYLIKFNNDGSITTTTKVTTEIYKEIQK